MPSTAYLTQKGLETLKAELVELKKKIRPEAIGRLETAKALGDLSENAEYHDAKDELAFVEGRIRELESTLNDVQVIEQDQPAGGIVAIGSTIEVESNGRRKIYQIVGYNEADPAAGRISNESPLGATFIGHKKGEQVVVETPGGQNTYTIIDVK